ncbi:ABC transporter permease [Paenarthrobacter nicotinovorans]|uniref:ABC transporter permease n=1 Tax=Paenarthrobacter nicotinovorans TaxID=29320 RepID=UPI003D673F98
MAISGLLSYRALFNWATPSMFLGTLLAAPVTQMIFFTMLGQELGIADSKFYVVGNAVFVASVAGLFGGTMSVANERRYKTLSLTILSPRPKWLLFGARAIPYIANGCLTSLFTLTIGVVIFRLDFAFSDVVLVVLNVCAASTSAAFFGLMLGAIGLRFRDVFMISNIAQISLLFFSGAQVPASLMPQWAAAVGNYLPLTHAIDSARRAAVGAELGVVLSGTLVEILLACSFALVASILLKVFEVEARKSASLDLD